MRKTTLGGIAAVTLALAVPPVMAASRPLQQWKSHEQARLCSDLVRQYDDAMSVRPAIAKAEAARHADRVDRKAEQQCDGAHYDTGIRTMADALRHLHLVPAQASVDAVD